MRAFRSTRDLLGRSRRQLVLSLAIGTVLSLTAMAGASSAASLQVGKTNKSRGQTTLSSSSKKKTALAISNTGGAAAASFTVKKGKAPFTVSSTAKVKNLNADLLDGLDSAKLQLRVGGTCGSGSAVNGINSNGSVSCATFPTAPSNVQTRVSGTCAPSSAIRVINADGTVVCQPVLVSVPPAWNLTGNSGTDPTKDFLGTIDTQPLVIRTNNTEAMRVTATGQVGIGTATPAAQLHTVSSGSENAIEGDADSGDGVIANSTNGSGVNATGTQNGITANGNQDGVLAGGNKDGVESRGTSIGVFGSSDANIGVVGNSGSSQNPIGTRGIEGTLNGLDCPGTYAVGGCAGANNAMVGESNSGIGVLGNSGVTTATGSRGVVGTLNNGSCPDEVGNGYAVGGCGGAGTGVEAVSTNDGVFALSHHASGGNTAAAVRAVNDGGGDIFIAATGTSSNSKVARINSAGTGFFDGGTQNSGADYAESVHAVNRSQLRPGDVLSIAPSHGYAVAKSTGAYSPLVVGVYSTKPAVLATGAQGVDASLAGQVPVAMMGVVPTKVTAAGGAIHPGDLLTTSRVPGYAMKAKATKIRGIAIYPQGTIIGKALQPLSHGQATIQVMLMSR